MRVKWNISRLLKFNVQTPINFKRINNKSEWGLKTVDRNVGNNGKIVIIIFRSFDYYIVSRYAPPGGEVDYNKSPAHPSVRKINWSTNNNNTRVLFNNSIRQISAIPLITCSNTIIYLLSGTTTSSAFDREFCKYNQPRSRETVSVASDYFAGSHSIFA